MELDVKTLKVVLAIAECASYSRAAQALGVTQPAVSRRILQLERQLHTKLFRREGHRFLPTETGKSVCEQARQILALANELPTNVQELTRNPAGTVALGLPSGLGELLAPRLLRKFMSRYPDVFVRLEQGYASDLAHMLATKQIDLAILHGKHSSSLFDITPLVQLELGLVFPSAWKIQGPKGVPVPERISLADIADFPMIMPGPLQSMRTVIDDAYRIAGASRNIVIECNGLGLCKALVRDGLGCMILSNSGLNKALDAKTTGFAKIVHPVIEWTTSMATRCQGEPTLATRLLAQMLQAEIRELVKAGEWQGRLVGNGP